MIAAAKKKRPLARARTYLFSARTCLGLGVAALPGGNFLPVGPVAEEQHGAEQLLEPRRPAHLGVARAGDR